MTRRSRCGLLALLLVLGLLVPAGSAHAVTTYFVNSTADDVDGGGCQGGPGDCTLREAILAANASPGLDKIHFALGAGVPTINITSQLPSITDRIHITGNTGGASRIELSGPGGVNGLDGLVVSIANQSIIRRLVINGFGHRGIVVFNSGGVGVTGTWIGTDETGLAAGGGGQFGIVLLTSVGASIGGGSPGEANVISGNDIGIEISGGSGHSITGNLIGTTRTGTGDLGNTGQGIVVFESDGNDFLFNVIAGNGNDGLLFINGSDDNDVLLNRIGVDAEEGALGNDGDGIVIAGTATGINVSTNRIAHNAGLGIDLGGDGVTPNDNADADAGPNDLINFPVLTRASTSGTTTTVKGRLRTSPNTLVSIDIYANAACDASGFGEGAFLVGFDSVTTDGEGRATFTTTTDIFVGTGGVLTAILRNEVTGSTSEFSACEVVV